MKSTLILPDLHVPAYNKVFIDGILKYIYLNRDYIDGIDFLGDFLDIQSINSYASGMVVDTDLGREYREANTVLDLFDEALGEGKSKHFLYGNHEDRVRKSLQLLAMSKYGSAIQTIEVGLNLLGRGYTVHSDYVNDILLLDDLSLFHGVYYNIHCCKKTSEVYKTNTMFGHTHREQTFSEGSYTSYNIGCCCDIWHPYFNYAPRGQKSYWVNSFSKVDSYMGFTSPKTIKLIDNKFFIVDGKIYK